MNCLHPAFRNGVPTNTAKTRALGEGEPGNRDADSLHGYFAAEMVHRGMVFPSSITEAVAAIECLLAGYQDMDLSDELDH